MGGPYITGQAEYMRGVEEGHPRHRAWLAQTRVFVFFFFFESIVIVGCVLRVFVLCNGGGMF